MATASRPEAPPQQSDFTQADVGRILAALEAVLGAQRRMEGELSALVTEQKAIAAVVCAGTQDVRSSAHSRAASKRVSIDTSQEAPQKSSGRPAGATPAPSNNKPADASPAAANSAEATGGDGAEDSHETGDREAHTSESSNSSVFPPGFLGKLAEAEAVLGKENIVKPSEAKIWLDSHPSTLFLDVQDGESPSVPGTYRSSLGQLFFKASGDLPEFRDPIIADRDKDQPILVTCGLGGQAKLGGKVLKEYGFNNVKVVDGGCMAWKTHFSTHPSVLPMNWPRSVQRRICYVEDAEAVDLTGMVVTKPFRSRSATGFAEEPQSCSGSVSATDTWKPSAMKKLSTTATAVQDRPSFILAPCSSLRIAIDIVSVGILVFDLVTVPWLLAWDIQIQGIFFVASVSTACFWTLDIFINFRTGFFFHGEANMNPAAIARRYLKTWFFPDVLMVLLDWASMVLLIIGQNDTAEQGATGVQVRVIGIVRFTKWSRVLRLVSMARFVRFSDVFERILDRSWYSPTFLVLIQVVRLLFVIVYVNHFGACLWWSIGKGAISNTGARWVDMEVDALGYTFLEADTPFQYVICLHWTMTQFLAGSMQVFATNSAEHMFTVTCLVFGVLFLSSLVSALAAKMTQLRMINQDKNRRLAQLREFLRRKSVSPELAVSMIKQVEDSIKDKKPGTVKELEVWSAVSQRHRRQLQEEICRPHIVKYPFFALAGQIEPKMVRRLCDMALDPEVHCQHDTVFTAGKVATQAYVVMGGTLKYSQDPETSMVSKEEEQIVLKGAMVCEAAIWTQWTHVGMLEATTGCELLVLKPQDVAEAFAHSNHVRQVACEYSRAFHARLQAAKPPHANWPNDITVPYTSFEEVMASMREQVRSYVGMLTVQFAMANYTWAPSLQRLRQDVLKGLCTVTTAATGDLVIISSAVALQLERTDGRVLVQLGTWDGCAAIPGFGLPGTRQLPGEVPCTAYQRLLQTQLQPLVQAVRLRKCVSEVESKADLYQVLTRTMTIKHVACVDVCSVPELPKVDEASRQAAASSGMSIRRFVSESTAVSPVEEVFVVAGESEPTVGVEEAGNEQRSTVLRLFAWVTQPVLDRLSSSAGQSELKRYLASVSVSKQVSERVYELWYDRHTSECTDPVASASTMSKRAISGSTTSL